VIVSARDFDYYITRPEREPEPIGECDQCGDDLYAWKRRYCLPWGGYVCEDCWAEYEEAHEEELVAWGGAVEVA